ncbi:MAG: hypothetical protein C4288_12980 [Leptolyngbya sp. ERB_1_1]
MLISSSTLRLIWTTVEEASPSDLLSFSDTALVKLLLQQISRKILLGGEEVCALYDYLGSKMSLIRDIAESRLLEENFSIEHSPLKLAEVVAAVA